jgi:1,2-dihydroxy-3-keto-5-methylthiopentene dioxygenase
MAIVTIPDQNRILTEFEEIKEHLTSIGIEYELWGPSIAPDAPPEEILRAYEGEIEQLKARGGYVTADVISVSPDTPGLEEMLAKFNREHWHSEDEVRFIIEGRGLFHIRPQRGPVTAIEVQAGDLICVPRQTRHWFNLCADRRIRAIRLFQDPAGWVPHYTNSGIDLNYQPICLGPSYIPPQEI